jgi:alcohol dehydrogenase (NADP+)
MGSTSYPDTFSGFMISNQKKWQSFTKQPIHPLSLPQSTPLLTTPPPPQFKPKQFNPTDIDIKITCYDVCGSDVHTITSGWGSVHLPLCVGHEIVGTAIKVGDAVTTVKVGDRVGVGAQIWACMQCPQCKSGNENYCPHMVGKSSHTRRTQRTSPPKAP